MSDLLADRLARLAPDVDMAASRARFEARRDGGEHAGSPGPRRTRLLAAAVLALLVAGLVGLIALTRGGDPATVPADRPGSTLAPPAATGVEFDLLLVEQVDAPFHELSIAADRAELDAAWAALDLPPTYPPPAVDFERRVAVVLTRPDNACPDTLARFRVDGSTWTPVFEVETGACNEPLLSWLYVVAVDRSAVTPHLTVHVPADELYGAPARSISATVAPPTGVATAPSEPELVATGITLPLPEVGRPELHATTLGFLWIVHHHDGTASVLPALIDLPASEDEGGVAGLAALVMSSEDGHTFGGPRWEWDAWGRTIGGPRTEDLVGFAGEIRGIEVAVFESDATTVPGEPNVREGAARSYGTALETQAPGLQPVDLETYSTLSSIAPRLLDATLVVEDGVGRICEIDRSPPVPDLATCGAGLVIETSITSARPDITVWHFGPLLAEFDTVGSVWRVAPLGGLASRNDGLPDVAPSEIEVIVDSARAKCRRDGAPVAVVELLAGADTAVNIEIVSEGAVLGRGYLEPRDGVLTPIEVELTDLPSGRWTVRVLTADHGSDELTAATFDSPPDPRAC